MRVTSGLDVVTLCVVGGGRSRTDPNSHFGQMVLRHIADDAVVVEVSGAACTRTC